MRTRDPRYATLLARREHEIEVRGLIESWSGQRDADEVMQTLQKAGVPCAALNNADRMLNRDPQFAERGLWREVEHPELGTTLIEGWGFRMTEDTASGRRAPLLGEHNDYVLQELIGLSEEEVNMHLVGDVLR